MPKWDNVFYKIKRPIIVVLLIVLLIPFYLVTPTKATICACVVFYMSVLWFTEIVPMAVTALIPMVAYPIFGILEAKELCFEYLTDANFVFFGSLIMAIGIESVFLHERIALMILRTTGTNPRWLMLGFQVSTAFLSMFMSNTATAAMMLPIVSSVICELDYCSRKHRKRGLEDVVKHEIEEISLKDCTERDRNTYKCLLLSICFSASIGGISTVIGTGPNLVMAAFLDELYDGNSPVTFASWMFYAFPIVIVMLIFLWIWLQVLFIGFENDPNEKEIEDVLHEVLEQKYRDLGPIQYSEKVISVLFAGMVLSWFFRDPKIFPGWGNLFPHGYVSDSTVSLFFAILLFIVPSENPFKDPILGEKVKKLEPILSWKMVHYRLSWGTIFLLGGGFAMAKGVEKSGLSVSISNQLSLLTELPSWIFVIFICILVTALTEFSSNIATASIFIPLVASIAKNKALNPLQYILPATLSSSFAFMLPAGTPPNAIVFSSNLLRVMDLMKAGALLNFFGLFVIVVATQTYGTWIFDIKDAPFNHTLIRQ